MTEPRPLRAGFVAILGRPNAGKSTLLNALVGEHLAAVTAKAQTTRHRIPGFLTEDGAQFVFVDTPGLLDPSDPLQEALLESAMASLDGVDAALWLVDHDVPSDRERSVLDRLQRAGVATFLLLTKVDQVPPGKLDARAATWGPLTAWSGTLRVSATSGEGLGELLARLRERLPEQPFFYPADDLTTLPLRFVGAELIREACYEELGAEVPYSVHVEIEEWKEPATPADTTRIRAVLYVERDSQKGIVIGDGGRKLKAIGTRARASIEAFIGGPVYLALWVKVRKKWSRRETDLKQFGYRP